MAVKAISKKKKKNQVLRVKNKLNFNKCLITKKKKVLYEYFNVEIFNPGEPGILSDFKIEIKSQVFCYGNRNKN